MQGFHEVTFPEDISWGSRGGPSFKTHVFGTFRGFERRNVEWAQPIMQFNVAYGVRTDDKMLRMMDFFNARQGAAYGFRYKNWANYEIVNAPVATGDGNSRRLPLYKFYGFQGARFYKRIRKIERGTVVGIQANNEPLVEGVDYTIDYDAGEIALVEGVPYGSPVYAQRLCFHEAVRFDIDNIQSVIDAYNSQSLTTLPLIGLRADFRAGSVFAPGETDDADPLYSITPLILNFDDLNDRTTTTDQSYLATPVVLDGSAQLQTDRFKHGGGSLWMGPNGTCSLSSSNVVLGKAAFTVEGFFSQPEDGAIVQPMIGCWRPTTGDTGWLLRYDFGRKRLEFLIGDDPNPDILLMSYPWRGKATQFDHISISRTLAGWYVMRINGDVVQTVKNSRNPLTPIGTPITVGSYETANFDSYQGGIDSIRITVGQTRDPGFERGIVPTPYSAATNLDM